ncbi:uncharacterized protein IL334_001503 [Kwoniella shivajii]|uniref:Uncharacterized protein n=1 Tax=Kwoniella shivajii TaxID=564305 RepID=A0ABZ1CS46_9TREE|nr:hypothetical protein IL334_001503 [Kwoniella shivajii]
MVASKSTMTCRSHFTRSSLSTSEESQEPPKKGSLKGYSKLGTRKAVSDADDDRNKKSDDEYDQNQLQGTNKRSKSSKTPVRKSSRIQMQEQFLEPQKKRKVATETPKSAKHGKFMKVGDEYGRKVYTTRSKTKVIEDPQVNVISDPASQTSSSSTSYDPSSDSYRPHVSRFSGQSSRYNEERTQSISDTTFDQPSSKNPVLDINTESLSLEIQQSVSRAPNKKDHAHLPSLEIPHTRGGSQSFESPPLSSERTQQTKLEWFDNDSDLTSLSDYTSGQSDCGSSEIQNPFKDDDIDPTEEFNEVWHSVQVPCPVQSELSLNDWKTRLNESVHYPSYQDHQDWDSRDLAGTPPPYDNLDDLQEEEVRGLAQQQEEGEEEEKCGVGSAVRHSLDTVPSLTHPGRDDSIEVNDTMEHDQAAEPEVTEGDKNIQRLNNLSEPGAQLPVESHTGDQTMDSEGQYHSENPKDANEIDFNYEEIAPLESLIENWTPLSSPSSGMKQTPPNEQTLEDHIAAHFAKNAQDDEIIAMSEPMKDEEIASQDTNHNSVPSLVITDQDGHEVPLLPKDVDGEAEQRHADPDVINLLSSELTPRLPKPDLLHHPYNPAQEEMHVEDIEEMLFNVNNDTGDRDEVNSPQCRHLASTATSAPHLVTGASSNQDTQNSPLTSPEPSSNTAKYWSTVLGISPGTSKMSILSLTCQFINHLPTFGFDAMTGLPNNSPASIMKWPTLSTYSNTESSITPLRLSRPVGRQKVRFSPYIQLAIVPRFCAEPVIRVPTPAATEKPISIPTLCPNRKRGRPAKTRKTSS